MKDPRDFARSWADAWNRRAVEDVLALFADEVVFTSPTALAVTGSSVVRGKQALRHYWNAAMAKVESIDFTLQRVLWDMNQRELAITYTARINGAAKSVSENLRFDAEGLIVSAEVFHGAPITAG